MTFLSYMAEKPQLVRHNGKSAVENVKEEKLYHVLTLASMDKDLDDIVSAYYESRNK